MDYKIDLHVHSYMSDGTFSPKEIVSLAVKTNVKAISLTDHDSVDGINEAYKSARDLNVDFINGVEISSLYKDKRKLHILGLGIDIKSSNFLKPYTKMKLAREGAIKSILQVIKLKGIDIDINDLKQNSVNKYLDRYDIHKYFIRYGISYNSQEIWDKYLDPIPYGKDELFTTEEAIDIIKNSGGLSFLAHYNKNIGLNGLTKAQMEVNIKYLIDMGLRGIERYYPSYSEEDNEFLDYIIDKYGIEFSGGTDFHGENRPEISLGTGYGNMSIPYSVYENIKNKI
ncbi:PHP domain-containing protein [Clostridium akagii]|uniref:PHP domain-containing protein n=1 Tax=Clostridium akagii TaxID=91623 RepID=UPI00047DC8D5|nr:PHP domain-containing protein [Clostridium akagii]